LAFTYDNAGRVKTVDNANTPTVPNVVLTSSYDFAGRRTRLANTMPGAPASTPAAASAGFVSYAYDAAGRMTRIQDGTFVGGGDVLKKRVDFSYNKRDQFATIKRFTNTGAPTNPTWSLVTQASFTYTADTGFLWGLAHTGPTGAMQENFDNISHDKGGRITRVTTAPTGAGLASFVTTFDSTRPISSRRRAGWRASRTATTRPAIARRARAACKTARTAAATRPARRRTRTASPEDGKYARGRGKG
jgi:hypothetical protein